jgi:hypothetical protein
MLYPPAFPAAPDTQAFDRMRATWASAQETDRILVPLIPPTLNDAQNWHPMQRAKIVHMIHEAVRLSTEHMFDREPWPEEWEWGSGDAPLVGGWVTRAWFIERWHTQVLRRKTCEPAGTGTVIEILRLGDNRHHVHFHVMLAKLRDEDQTYTKHMLDGLVHAGMFPDDNHRVIEGVTKTQQQVAGKCVKISKNK